MVTRGPAGLLHGRRSEREALGGLRAAVRDGQSRVLVVSGEPRVGRGPDRFLGGLAVRSLLAEAAEEQPLLCVVDDAHWLDRVSAQALVFVARRLLAESVALVLVTREAGDELEGLPKLAVEGLS